MAQTQKIYLGTEPAFVGYLGDNPISELQGSFNPNTIDYLVVAGGGSSGADSSGGGGAGGYISSFIEATASFSLTAIVGNGGQSARTNGNNSSLIGAGINEVAIGGGGGGTNANAGLTGGSGGGSGRLNRTQAAGTVGQGNSGSYAEPGLAGNGGGGGGGAAADGLDVPTLSDAGADGGPGKQWYNGNYYAGGGGGAGYQSAAGGAGGIGGGGDGGNTFNSPTGSAGAPNTGGGGGAAFTFSEGGSGIVIIRYFGNTQKGSGGDNIYYSGSYWYHEFTSVDTGSFSYTYS